MPPKPRKPTGPLWTILLLAPPATALNPRYRFCAMDVITNCYHRWYHWPITVIQEWSSQLLSHATSGYFAIVLGTEESIFWHCAILQLHPLLPESPPKTSCECVIIVIWSYFPTIAYDANIFCPSFWQAPQLHWKLSTELIQYSGSLLEEEPPPLC